MGERQGSERRPEPAVDGAGLRVLLVEDNPGDARLLEEALVEAGLPRRNLSWVNSARGAVTRLAEGGIDVALLDLTLPDVAGEATLDLVLRSAGEAPVVVLTGSQDGRLASAALHQGAQDYLLKGQIDPKTILRTLRYAVERHRARREIERLREEQLRLKDEFLSILSHDLRSPMHAITLALSSLRGGLSAELGPAQRECVEIASQSAAQLQRMLEDLFDLSRARAGRLSVECRPCSVRAVLLATVQGLSGKARAKGVRLELDLPEELPEAIADLTRLRQVVTNLIENALRWTPGGGLVQLLVASAEAEVTIQVVDTGVGMKAEELARAFEPFFRAEASAGGREGLGLGLSICHQLVERMQGRITMESEPGAGTRVTVGLARPTAQPNRTSSVPVPNWRERSPSAASLAVLLPLLTG